MVLLGPGEETMAMGPERSKPLHNFMLPCLKWGSQRYLRCMKVPSADDGGRRSPAPPTARKRELDAAAAAASDVARGSEKRMKVMLAARAPSSPGVHGGDDGGIDAVREKLMLDLKTEADRMKDAILRKEVAVAEEEEEDDGDGDVAAVDGRREMAPTVVLAAAAVAEARPWNLRTRRAACKAPAMAVAGGESGKGMLRIEEKRPNSSPLRTTGGGGGGAVVKSPKLRGSPEKVEKVKFSLPLTRKEVEEDFFELVGHRPPRRPKKRPRIVQKQLDTLFPGLWLSEVSADSYKVPEEETGKR